MKTLQERATGNAAIPLSPGKRKHTHELTGVTVMSQAHKEEFTAQ